MIYLTVCYFGSFPNYFQLYLDSVEINADIFRIILITDIDLSKYKIPTNVIHFNITLDEIRERAKLFFLNEYHKLVSITDIIKKPYKLCDYRPIYHILFTDIYKTLKIDETDHIGWTDIDVIHGKLSSFLDLKNNYDILGIQGHFTAIKNIPKYITSYKHIDRLFDRLIDERSMFIDENTFIDTFMETFKDKLNVFKMYNYHCDISPDRKELTMAGREREIIKHLQRDVSGKLIVHFVDGRVQETSYCHLQKRAMNVEFEVNLYKDTYYITFDSFFQNCPIKNDVIIDHENKDQVTIVLTSCNRPKLLDKTLESFVKYNTYPIYQTLLIDDSGVLHCNTDICKKYPQLNITEIYNIKNMGQIASIDKVYAMVKTKWIFHCEEDWHFLEYSFIEKSMKILKEDKTDKIFTVWLRPHNDTNGHPVIKDSLGRGFYEMSRIYETVGGCIWRGITLNPGLRKTSMCMKFHPYMKHCRILLDYTKINEYSLNDIYGLAGYYSVILDKPSGHVTRIGWDHNTNPSR
jgi:hypothetical protein